MVEYQACKTALESVDQSQVYESAGSVYAHKKSLEMPEESQRCKQANLKCSS